MRALSLTQPWATLVAIGAKSIETRSWHTMHRGPIAIHAAKKFPNDARCICPRPPFAAALGDEVLYTGMVLAIANLVECFRFDERTERLIRRRSALGNLPAFEAEFGDFAPGRHGFVLRDVRRLETPIPYKGALGLWTLPDDLLAGVAA